MEEVALIGAQVRHLRQLRSMSQQELATLVGWHQPAISSFENGLRNNLNITDLMAIARALDVRVELLLEPVTFHHRANENFSTNSKPAQLLESVYRLSPIQRERIRGIFDRLIHLAMEGNQHD